MSKILKNNKIIAQTNKNNEMIAFFSQINFMFKNIYKYIQVKKQIKKKLNIMEAMYNEHKVKLAINELHNTKITQYITTEKDENLRLFAIKNLNQIKQDNLRFSEHLKLIEEIIILLKEQRNYLNNGNDELFNIADKNLALIFAKLSKQIETFNEKQKND